MAESNNSVSKLLKLKNGLTIHKQKKISEGKEQVEVSKVLDEDGQKVACFTTSDGKLVESAAKAKVQEMGIQEEAAKKIGVSADIQPTVASLASEKADDDQVKDESNNQEAEKEKFVNNSKPKESLEKTACKGPTIDYSKINKIERKPSPTIDYSKINKISVPVKGGVRDWGDLEPKKTNTIDYSKVNPTIKSKQMNPLGKSVTSDIHEKWIKMINESKALNQPGKENFLTHNDLDELKSWIADRSKKNKEMNYAPLAEKKEKPAEKAPQIKEGPPLDYAKINAIKPKPEAPAINYAEMKEKPAEPGWKQDIKLKQKRIPNSFVNEKGEVMIKGEQPLKKKLEVFMDSMKGFKDPLSKDGDVTPLMSKKDLDELKYWMSVRKQKSEQKLDDKREKGENMPIPDIEKSCDCPECLQKRAPKGVDPQKHERCVQGVKEQGKSVGSAHAICTASLKKQMPMGSMVDTAAPIMSPLVKDDSPASKMSHEKLDSIVQLLLDEKLKRHLQKASPMDHVLEKADVVDLKTKKPIKNTSKMKDPSYENRSNAGYVTPSVVGTEPSNKTYQTFRENTQNKVGMGEGLSPKASDIVSQSGWQKEKPAVDTRSRDQKISDALKSQGGGLSREEPMRGMGGSQDPKVKKLMDMKNAARKAKEEKPVSSTGISNIRPVLSPEEVKAREEKTVRVQASLDRLNTLLGEVKSKNLPSKDTEKKPSSAHLNIIQAVKGKGKGKK